MDRILQQHVDDLVRVGTLTPGDQEYGQPGYDSAFCITGKDKARSIGQKVNEHGGFSAMQEVAYAAVDRMGKQVQVELDYCWNGIGQWRS